MSKPNEVKKQWRSTLLLGDNQAAKLEQLLTNVEEAESKDGKAGEAGAEEGGADDAGADEAEAEEQNPGLEDAEYVRAREVDSLVLLPAYKSKEMSLFLEGDGVLHHGSDYAVVQVLLVLLSVTLFCWQGSDGAFPSRHGAAH